MISRSVAVLLLAVAVQLAAAAHYDVPASALEHYEAQQLHTIAPAADVIAPAAVSTPHQQQLATTTLPAAMQQPKSAEELACGDSCAPTHYSIVGQLVPKGKGGVGLKGGKLSISKYDKVLAAMKKKARSSRKKISKISSELTTLEVKDKQRAKDLRRRIHELRARNHRLLARIRKPKQLRGPRGAKGKPGPPGRVGARGAPGRIGRPGPTGRNGATGRRGKTGSRGLPGRPGRNGKPGKEGGVGRTGLRGHTGSPGAPGKRGAEGREGARGPRGPDGARGVEGHRGPKGYKGPTGARGPSGEVGNVGRKGPKGKDGATGWAGHTGRKGATGIRGNRGIEGKHGRVGKVGPYGHRGYTGLKGPTGHRGANGYTGAPGAQGRRGPTGPTGAPGGRGANGKNGKNGKSAPAGKNGANGKPGAAGVRGAPGDTGHAGPHGFRGIPGLPGPRGRTGARGPSGKRGAPGAPGARGPRGHAGHHGYLKAHGKMSHGLPREASKQLTSMRVQLSTMRRALKTNKHPTEAQKRLVKQFSKMLKHQENSIRKSLGLSHSAMHRIYAKIKKSAHKKAKKAMRRIIRKVAHCPACPRAPVVQMAAKHSAVGKRHGVIHTVIKKPDGKHVTLQGSVINYLNNRHVHSAHVTIYKHKKKVAFATSNGNGHWAVQIKPGKYRIKVKAHGFIGATVHTEIKKGDRTGTVVSGMSPALEKNQARFVLVWGDHPQDLDSHLILPENKCTVIYYKKTCDNWGVAKLDLDATRGSGPETITIPTPKHGTYKYEVVQYSNDGTLAKSEARVYVFANGKVKTFRVEKAAAGKKKNGKIEGRKWNVFKWVVDHKGKGRIEHY